MTSRLLVPPKAASETVVVPVDFAPLLAVGQTISTTTALATVYSGTDASPPTLTPTVSGTVVSVPISGGVLGVTYSVRVTANTTSPTATLTMSFYLTVTPDLP